MSVTPQESGRSLINHVNSIRYIISVPSWVTYWSSFSSNSRMYYSIREHFKHTLKTTQWPLSGEHVLSPLITQDYTYVRWTNLSPSLDCGGNSSHLQWVFCAWDFFQLFCRAFGEFIYVTLRKFTFSKRDRVDIHKGYSWFELPKLSRYTPLRPGSSYATYAMQKQRSIVKGRRKIVRGVQFTSPRL